MVGVPEPPGNRPIRQGLPSAQAQGVRPLAFSTSMLTSSSRFCEKKCAITHPERRGFYCPVCSIGYGSNWNHNGRATKEKTHHVCTGKGQQDQPFAWYQDHNAAGPYLNDPTNPIDANVCLRCNEFWRNKEGYIYIAMYAREASIAADLFLSLLLQARMLICAPRPLLYPLPTSRLSNFWPYPCFPSSQGPSAPPRLQPLRHLHLSPGHPAAECWHGAEKESETGWAGRDVPQGVEEAPAIQPALGARAALLRFQLPPKAVPLELFLKQFKR